MKSSESRIPKKMLKLKRAFKGLVREILDHPVVEKGFGIALLIYWGIGFLGLVWMVIAFGAFIISGFKSAEGSITDWLRDFTVACPGLAFIWLLIAITTCWMFIHEEKKQNNQANQDNQTEAKAQ